MTMRNPDRPRLKAGRAPVPVGTSGWSYEHWQGVFYPQELPADHWLAYYAQRFSSVEINNSFYHLPRKNTLRR